MNRIKQNTDEKILKILKKSVYNDLKELDCDNISEGKDEILFKCIETDYAYKKELFSELYLLED